MRASDIVDVKIEPGSGRSSVPMLENEIAGATVIHHTMGPGDRLEFPASPEFFRILFLCGGSAAFASAGSEAAYAEKAVFVPHPREASAVAAATGSHLLEIRWELGEKDRGELERLGTAYPVTAKYADAVQYRDPFKSDKTISRAIIPHRLLPRFAMGSVETYDDDLIGQHEHPLLDQFFFSFPENDMTLLLDDLAYPMGGNTLLHVPLGCNHGVKVEDGQCAHYIWIDFLSGDEAVEYLDEVHKETGTRREFGETSKK